MAETALTSNIRESNGTENAAAPLVSVIVNNYNYGRFLPQAIDSALGQTHPRLEVIVVDDGSTDNSREVISRYGSRIQPVLKSNGGQASALNAGFAASRGDVVLFLDADDFLYPSAVANAVALFAEEGVSKVHWPLEVIDGSGARTGETRPPQIPPGGDFRQQVLERGPSNVASSPTSGNAWARSFLKRTLPIPEDAAYYRLCADEYLYTLAPIFGQVRTIPQPQGCYRIHGANVYSSRSFLEKLELELEGHEEQCSALSAALARNGIMVDVESWKLHSWFHTLNRAVADILAVVPEGSELLLIDGGTWGIPQEFVGRTVRPFLELDGVDGGPPEDDQAAIRCLVTRSANDFPFIVVAWPCFWWFNEYARFSEYLYRLADCVLSNEAVVIFHVRPRCSASIAVAGCHAMTATEGGNTHA
jgi:glycosyltransferase involved in cell wall biosynthesis